MARTWTCQRVENGVKCGAVNRGMAQRCELCGVGKRPKRRRPAHQLTLDVPYAVWVQHFGDRCNICGRPPGPNRNLDRDHDHRDGGSPRGLLCHACNRALPNWMTADWLRKATAYLERDRPDLDEFMATTTEDTDGAAP